MTGTLAHGNLAATPLTAWHAAHGGRLVDFAGWSMPVQYGSIVAEHQATRTAAGLFDISHMGRLRFDGPGAAAYVDGLVTRSTATMPAGRIRYALMTRDDGGILDDVLVYHLQDESAGGRSYRLVVVNAGNRQKILDWIAQHSAPADVQWADLTTERAMIAVQGPRALALTAPLLDVDPQALKYYTGREGQVAGTPGIVSRTGYTGEDGVELIVAADRAVAIWEALIAAGAVPVGLGARDTLRLEAGMPLYGHELSEEINPFQAGLAMAVDLDKPAFIGQAGLRAVADQQDRQPCRVGLTVEAGRVPRGEEAILAGETVTGRVTSGTSSPTLGQTIAMGYVAPQHASPGTELAVEVRGRRQAARVVELPFYRRAN